MAKNHSLLTGFTLIEVLVVVTIIAIMAAMLMPAINLVRLQAMNMQCANNLRMVGLATIAYTTDNRSMLPYADTQSAPWTDWYDKVNEYVDSTYQGNVYKGNNAFRCPLASREVRDQYQFWGRFSFQYSMNDNLRAWWNAGVWVNGRKPTLLGSTRAGQVLFQDGCIIRNGPGQVRYVIATQYDTPFTWARGAWPIGGNPCFDDQAVASTANLPIIRHRGRVNQAFVDGHVTPVVGTWNTAEQTAAFR